VARTTVAEFSAIKSDTAASTAVLICDCDDLYRPKRDVTV